MVESPVKRQFHLHLHFDGSSSAQVSSRRSGRRLLSLALDVGFYMLMAAAVVCSLSLFLNLYGADLDPNAASYRLKLMRQTSKFKRLFSHDRGSNKIRELVGPAGPMYSAQTPFSNASAARSKSQFRKFVSNLMSVNVPVVLYKSRLNLKGPKSSFSCGGSNVVKLQSYRQMRGATTATLPGLLPDDDPFPYGTFDSCAVVGNSGSLLENEYGLEIDDHDAVFRFNSARIAGFQQFVGSKTTLRLLNSPDAVWPKDGGEDTLMTIRTHEQILGWMKMLEKKHAGSGQAFITDPEFLCHTWDWVQQTGDKPSSGLVGVVIALKLCKKVNLYGFQSSNYFGRFTRPHYYDWERPKKGREKVHPFAREVWLYQELHKYGYITIHE